MTLRAALALILPFASPVLAEGFLLHPPIDCDLNSTSCYIQQYVDLDPGPGVTDYHCAGLSYGGHKGTDFALPTLAHMQAGVAVLAAAPGIVGGVRDGMPDTGLTPETKSDLAGRECGNGVVIRHADGWETQYCHLRQGSVTVATGDQVAVGDPLGLVGQSGLAQFPHVHLSVRKDGAQIDPFDPDGTLTCATPGDSTLWAAPPAYRPGGILDAGFNIGIPEFQQIKAGTATLSTVNPEAPAIILFGFTFGTRKDDIIRLFITGPEGTVITQDVEMERAQAQAFRAVGKKRRNAPWAAGTYQGTVTLIRDGAVIGEMTRTLSVE